MKLFKIKPFIILINLILLFILSCKQTNSIKLNSNSVNDTTKESKYEFRDDSLLSIIGVGDIMMGSNYPNSSSLPPDDGKYLFQDVSDILNSADITCGNLEGTLLDAGGTPKVCNDSGGHCISFRMPEHYASYLKDAGFDFLNLANNHSGDMGIKGRESTVETLDKYDLCYAGTLEYPTVIFEKNGIKYGFAGFAPNRGTNSINNFNNAKEIVSDLKNQVDIVIVFFHGGAEGVSAQNVPKRDEIFLGEDRGDVYEFAHGMIDAGADVVFGSGPHVTRAIELYDDRIIAYSLGNFCTYAKFDIKGVLGIAPIIKIYINNKGEFKEGKIIPVKQIKRGIPVLDDKKQVIKVLQNLSEKNFPQSKLIIDDDGFISIKDNP